MSAKKIYSREEKIQYFAEKVVKLEYALERAKANLERVTSPDYQDWSDSVSRAVQAKIKQFMK